MGLLISIWAIVTFLMLTFSGPGGALFVGVLTFPLAVILGRKASSQRGTDGVKNGREGFARINKFDEERSIGRDAYLAMIKDFEGLTGRAKTLIVQSRTGREFSLEEMRNLADDLRWACDEVDDYRLTFRRTSDRNAYRDLMIHGRFCSAVLHAAAEEQRSPAEFDMRVFPLKGRFQMRYENAHGDASQWEISALGLSAIGANRYLWLYSDKVIGVRHFRLDRILSITDVKSGDKAEGAAVPDWLAQRAGAV